MLPLRYCASELDAKQLLGYLAAPPSASLSSPPMDVACRPWSDLLSVTWSRTDPAPVRQAGRSSQVGWLMRKQLVIVSALGFGWIGYLVWPVYDLLVVTRAIETRDVDTVAQHVYFDAVRISLTNQVVDAYIRRTGVE